MPAEIEVTVHGTEADTTITPTAASTEVSFAGAVAGAEAPPPDPAAPAATPAVPARPDWLPQEFESAEQMAKAYAEMKGGAPAAEAGAEPQAEAPDELAAAAAGGDIDPVAQIVKAAGLDFEVLSQHYSETGTVTEESQAKLTAAGYPPALVNQFLEGTKALITNYRVAVVAAAGGDEVFQKASTWAASNMSESELAAYNASVESMDYERAKLAVAGVIGKYQGAQGREPQYAEGAGPAISVAGFESRAQMTAAMRDPRYAKDPAFRQEVETKLANSPGIF